MLGPLDALLLPPLPILTHELLSTVIHVSTRPKRNSRHMHDQWPVALADNKMPRERQKGRGRRNSSSKAFDPETT